MNAIDITRATLGDGRVTAVTTASFLTSQGPIDISNTRTSFSTVTSDGDAWKTSRVGNWSLEVEEDVARFLQQKNDEFTMLVLPAMIFLGILFVVGVSGNSVVLYVYNRRLQKGTIRWFVQALAIFDLLSCLVAIPGEIIDMRNNYTFGSSPMCKVLRTVSMFCTVASGMTLMVVAVERYKRICTPLRKQITPKGAQVIMTVCTVIASICAAPASIIYGPQTITTDNPRINGSDCSTADALLGTPVPLAFSAFQFMLFFLGALGLVLLYSLIGRKVWSHEHFRRVGFQQTGIHKRMSLFFSGSDCSSPTTDDLVFTFTDKRTSAGMGSGSAVAAAVAVARHVAEESSNTSQGNDTNDNLKVSHKAGIIRKIRGDVNGHIKGISDITGGSNNNSSKVSSRKDGGKVEANDHLGCDTATTNKAPSNTNTININNNNINNNYNNNIHPRNQNDDDHALAKKDRLVPILKKDRLSSTEGTLPPPCLPTQPDAEKMSLPSDDLEPQGKDSQEVNKLYCNGQAVHVGRRTKTSGSDDDLDRSSEGQISSGQEDNLNFGEEFQRMLDINLSSQETDTDIRKNLDERASNIRSQAHTLGKDLMKHFDRQVSWEVAETPDKESAEGFHKHQRNSLEELDGKSTPPQNEAAVTKTGSGRQATSEQDQQPSSPTSISTSSSFPQLGDTFRRPKSISRQVSRDRVRSGDSTRSGGRYRRRSIQHTQADMRRFLHRSESVTSGTRRTTLMLFLITMVYLLSFLPYLVLMIVKVLDEASLSGGGDAWEMAHNILLRSYFINSMANPVIYSFCSRTFRKECSRLLHFCKCSCKCKCESPTLFVY